MRALSVGAIVIGNRAGSGILVTASIEDVDPDPAARSAKSASHPIRSYRSPRRPYASRHAGRSLQKPAHAPSLGPLVSRLQEGGAATGWAIAGRCIHTLFSWQAIRQRSAFRLVRGIIQIGQQAFSRTSISLGAGGFDLLQHEFKLLNLRSIFSEDAPCCRCRSSSNCARKRPMMESRLLNSASCALSFAACSPTSARNG